VTGSNVL